ncbi:MAG: phosphoglucosamine mutase, partial [Oscillospiraceae bacterium]|nr:phosphoglucosamine mutase [Oscillospiraceae bacterium]
CGSTHMEALQAYVKEHAVDAGIAFDGDADRCLAVDETGAVVDGDRIMAICATEMRKRGQLRNNGFVATVMSNLGLHRFAEQEDLKLLCSSVGDRNVLELMQKEDLCLGGEQSGHVIFLDHVSTGDGQLTALQLLAIVCSTGEKLSTLASRVRQYPQVLLNVKGPHANADKDALIKNPELQKAVKEAENALKGDGRILVRPSGTEALIRVMVEASTEELAEQTANSVAKKVESLQNS